MPNKDETALLITPGRGHTGSNTVLISSRATAAVLGLDAAITDRRALAEAFGRVSGDRVDVTLIDGSVVRGTIRLDPAEVRRLCTPGSGSAEVAKSIRADRKRMRGGQHQLKRDYFVPAGKMRYWVMCWLGSLCLVAAGSMLLGVWLMR